MKVILAAMALITVVSCTKKDSREEVWVYTSLYKDTISDIQPFLEKQYPNIKVNFFQAGSEEIASKVNAEELAGGTKADLIIASDRFWYEDLAQQGKLHAYSPANADKVDASWKHPQNMYTTVSIPIMTLVYNSDAVSEKEAPKTFKEMADPKWKGKFTTGSPLASGTNFTTVAILQKKYGWDYFQNLRKNDTIAEGGNSAVLRRVQTKERPVGWVLLENSLRVVEKDPKLKIVYPQDGVVLQVNLLAITKKSGSREAAQKVADWMFSKDGQEAMVRSYMYAAVPGYQAPRNAPELPSLTANATAWSPDLIADIMKQRETIKEQFTKIMFQ